MKICILALATVMAFSTSVAWAVGDDDDDVPVVKTHTKHKALAKAASSPAEKTSETTPVKEADNSNPLACPERIDVAAQEPVRTPQGWHSFADSDTVYTLDSVMIYEGQKTLTKLSPDKGTESYTEWTLADNGKDKYYLVCGYAHTSVQLKRTLDKSYKSCRLSFETNTTNPAQPAMLRKMTCQ